MYRVVGFLPEVKPRGIRLDFSVINEETADTLVAAIGFRNVLAHEYGHVEYDEVYETLQTGLSVYDMYSQQIAQWLRKSR